MKSLFIIYALITCIYTLVTYRAFSQNSVADIHIEPTGTYILKGTVKKNHITGHSGEIRIQLLENDRLAICFYMNNGYPDNQSITFIDTLLYDNADNQLRYTPPQSPDCTLLFNFTVNKLVFLQLYNNPPCHCVYNQEVMIPAVFEKSSSDKPVIQDLAARGIND